MAFASQGYRQRDELLEAPEFVEMASAEGVAQSAAVATDDAAVASFRALLKQLPRTGNFIRPVVILRSVEVDGERLAIVTRALEACGVAAVVMESD